MCVPKKSEDVNLNVFIMVRRRNETKAFTKHIWKFDGEKCNSNQREITIQFDVHIEIQSEIDWYLKSIVHDLVIKGDESIDVSDTMSVNLNDKKSTCKLGNYYILLTFQLVTILLLITTLCY